MGFMVMEFDTESQTSESILSKCSLEPDARLYVSWAFSRKYLDCGWCPTVTSQGWSVSLVFVPVYIDMTQFLSIVVRVTPFSYLVFTDFSLRLCV